MILKFCNMNGKFIGYGSVCRDKWRRDNSTSTIIEVIRPIGIRLGILRPDIRSNYLYVERFRNYDTVLVSLDYQWKRVARIFKV